MRTAPRAPGRAFRVGPYVAAAANWCNARSVVSRILTVIACALLLLGPSGSEARSRARRGEPPPKLVTDRQEYAAAGLPARVVLTIGLRYTNHANGPRFFPGCKEPDPPCLEKLVSGQWVAAYCPIVRSCGGPPVVVAAGTSYDYRYNVFGAFWEHFEPEFQVREVAGTYRVRWRAFQVWIPDGPQPGHGQAALPEELTTNTFTVRAAP